MAWILLTHPDPGNTIHLVDVDSGVRVVWLGEMDRRLRPMVRGITRTDLLNMLILIVANAPGTSEQFARVMEEIGEPKPPPRSVVGLARASGVRERPLRYLWAEEEARAGSLKELVDWLVLGWALRRKRALGSWDRVAAELDLKKDTLRALRIRRTGLTLGSLEKSGGDALRRMVMGWWEGEQAG